MDLLAITAQLYVLHGTVQDDGAVPGLLAHPAPQKAARGRERDFLFIHLTLSGPPQETADLTRELAEELGKRFFAAAGSVTSALRRAVIETNEQLLRHNLGTKTPREGALTCAVLHGGELYTLQVGEGLAFLGHNFGVERLPVRPPQHLTPLGRSAGIDIRFVYHQLQSSDMLLLADPRLAYLTGAALAPVLVDTEIESGLEALMDVVAGDTARLLLVEFADELPSTLPLSFQHSRKPPQKTDAPKVAAPVAQVREGTVPSAAALPRSEGDGSVSMPPVVVASAAGTASATAASIDGATAVETSARRVASTSARGLSRFTAWLADVLGRLRGGEPAALSIHWAIPATVALLIPIMVAAVITSVYLQRGNVEEVSRIKQQMIEEMLAAEAAGDDPAQAQAHYVTLIGLAADAEALRPDDLEVARMRAEARDALDRLDGVSRLSGTVFYRYNDGSNLTRITLRGVEGEGGLAVMDATANRVLFHPTDETYRNATTEEPSTIAFSNQAVGAQTIGLLFDILWLPGSASATRDSIAMADRGGGLFRYYPNLGDIGGAILGNSSAWLNPAAIATYLDRLYVLDNDAGQIWKYYIDSGFAQFPDDEAIFFSGEAELDQAVDFDLYADDGSLVVLYRDGRIRYYDTRSGRIQWDENTLLQSGLTTPLIAPVAVKMVGSGLNASIFVLDPGNGRLIQLSRGGTVLTQYRVLDEAGEDLLSRASDFAVAESPLTVFVVAGDGIYLADR